MPVTLDDGAETLTYNMILKSFKIISNFDFFVDAINTP